MELLSPERGRDLEQVTQPHTSGSPEEKQHFLLHRARYPRSLICEWGSSERLLFPLTSFPDLQTHGGSFAHKLDLKSGLWKLAAKGFNGFVVQADTLRGREKGKGHTAHL